MYDVVISLIDSEYFDLAYIHHARKTWQAVQGLKVKFAM